MPTDRNRAIKCSVCKGLGYIMMDKYPYDNTVISEEECKNCKGLGYIMMDKYKRNKFYIGSNSVVDGREYGSPTLEQAIEQAKKRIEKGEDEIFIVEIIRVVRSERRPARVDEV